MSMPIRAMVIILAAVVALFAAAGSIRWAKRNSTGAQFIASAMILVLGIGGVPIVNPPQQGIEEAREDKGTKGSESGDPPAA